MRFVLPVLVLSGCWLTNEELGQKLVVEVDTGDALDPLVIAGVSPAFGSTAGGTEVTIEAGPLASDAPVVRFGGASASIVSFDEDSLVVLAPAVLGAGPVAVSVEDSGRSINSEGAFTYYDDHVGQNTVIGEFAYITFIGDAWGTQIERPEDYGYGWVSFVQPTSVVYSDLLHDGRVDTCSRGYSFGGGLVDLPVNASSVTLHSGATSLDFAWNSTNLGFERDLTIAEYRPGSTFDMAPVDSQVYPAFEVPGMVRTPLPFQVTQPEFDTWVSSSFSVSWNTAETGDYVILAIDLWDDNLGDFVESVTCLVADDGTFRVESSNFTQWVPFSTTVRIGVGRFIESDAVMAHDNSSSAMVGAYWIYGLANADL